MAALPDDWMKAWHSPLGRALLAARVLAFVCGLVVLLWWWPWLMATPISGIKSYGSPSPPPPPWALSFAVSHGQFRYFPDSIQDSPWKAGAVGAVLVALWFVERRLVFHIRKLPDPEA
ncbi:hypothetical protein llg_17080 [Luteolibacter sp. LG18]|nr:hypothetical protein llg_17080 [Luteolibacter sp. LG18]